MATKNTRNKCNTKHIYDSKQKEYITAFNKKHNPNKKTQHRYPTKLRQLLQCEKYNKSTISR